MPNKKTAKTALRKSLPEADLELVPQRIAPLVQLIRGEKVLLDADLAELYGVETKALNQAVKRNQKRFPTDFMFQLTRKEWSDLRCQFGTSSSKSAEIELDTNLKSQSVTSRHGGRRTPPYAFPEQIVKKLRPELQAKVKTSAVRDS
ncbi:MAG: ORF6N domain-containing protein [Puniceicoccaceae bacterium]|nr:MAG: ORF6N domain-containing protein [Puniceicoccaceae bacterium]